MKDKPASQQIDDIINKNAGWKGELLNQVRSIIRKADPDVIEEIKWRMASRPEGLAVWSHNGILCFAEIWKDNIKLLFPKGALMKDSEKVFNARLKSKTARSIEFREGDMVNEIGLEELIHDAFQLNGSAKK